MPNYPSGRTVGSEPPTSDDVWDEFDESSAAIVAQRNAKRVIALQDFEGRVLPPPSGDDAPMTEPPQDDDDCDE